MHAYQHYASVRVPPHIKRLDDCFGDFLVRVVCDCGACREIQPQALARLVGWKMTFRELALRMRCSRCGRRAAEVVAKRSQDPGSEPQPKPDRHELHPTATAMNVSIARFDEERGVGIKGDLPSKAGVP
jgi:hypothetical protein